MSDSSGDADTNRNPLQEITDEMMAVFQGRLRRMASLMMNKSPRLRRLATSDDLIQDAAVLLIQGIHSTRPAGDADLSKWAYVQLCRALVDLARKLYGPHGYGKNTVHATDMSSGGGAVERELGVEPTPEVNTADGEAWAMFYSEAQKLTGTERNIFELVWFERLTQEEVAQKLGISERQVRRYWALIRQKIGKYLPGSEE